MSPCSAEPWRDCAPCHSLSDGDAGKRYTNLILINRPDQGLHNSRRTDRRRFPAASDPPWVLPTPASGCPVAHWRSLLPEIRPARRAPGSILSRYSTVTTCFGGFGLSMKDTLNYYGIIVDSNTRQTICRLRFGARVKNIGLFDDEGNENRNRLASLSDINDYAEQLRSRASLFA